uniref:Tubby-related protein 4 n=1 Tax=Plectus sambesii TaxID=2011161 RepID=A0A914V219_9BILA
RLSGNGEYLALAATSSADDSGNKRAQCVNQLFLFNGQGVCLQVVAVPVSSDKRLTAFTWAHDDQVVVLAAGGDVAVGRVVHTVPPLFLLASYRVWGLLGGGNEAVESLPLPTREKAMVLAHNDHIIQCRIPAPRQLCRSVCHPSCWRWYCTIRPVPRKAQTYMLCMEHMGGLVPVLIGRQINRLLPEFEIRLPKPSPNYRAQSASRSRSRTPDSIGITADVEDKTPDSPFQRSNLQRNSVWRRSKRQLRAIVHRAQQHAQGSSSAKYEEKLVQVTSNVWCTRFKVTGMSPSVLPPYLGQ